jgi:putative ATPase
VYVLNELNKNSLEALIDRALSTDEWLKSMNIELVDSDELVRLSGGDGRKLLNLLEVTVQMNGQGAKIGQSHFQKAAQYMAVRYDKNGEQHYDIVSAFIKSMRGSDPNASVYWLARMIKAGEDPIFIARRMLIFASEDIGIANPNAMLLAESCLHSVKMIGYPECRIILSQTAVYLATSTKSNSSYMAIEEALSWVDKTGNLPVPLHLRNSPTKLMKDLGYGDDYKYPHHFEQNFSKQEYLPENIKGKKFFEPGKNQREEEIRKFLSNRWREKYGY